VRRLQLLANPAKHRAACLIGHRLTHKPQESGVGVGAPGGDNVSRINAVDEMALSGAIAACQTLMNARLPEDEEQGAAAMLLGDGTIVVGTAPTAVNSSVDLCHETEPFCAAYRLNQRIVASVCLHRQQGGRTVVLSPCGVCRERLAVHGPHVLVAVPDRHDVTAVVWKGLKELLPDYWLAAFLDEVDAGWTG
jgi:cytidine deaminase